MNLTVALALLDITSLDELTIELLDKIYQQRLFTENKSENDPIIKLFLKAYHFLYDYIEPTLTQEQKLKHDLCLHYKYDSRPTVIINPNENETIEAFAYFDHDKHGDFAGIDGYDYSEMALIKYRQHNTWDPIFNYSFCCFYNCSGPANLPSQSSTEYLKTYKKLSKKEIDSILKLIANDKRGLQLLKMYLNENWRSYGHMQINTR